MSLPEERDGRDRAASLNERVYRALTSVYPEELRHRYGEEMVRYFGDLCREELRSRGWEGLAALWVRTLVELVFTALKERSTMLARNAYLPVRPTVVAKWGALLALAGGVLGAAYYLIGLVWLVPVATASSALEEANAIGRYPVAFEFVLIPGIAFVLCILGLVGLYGKLVSLDPASGRTTIPGRVVGTGAVLVVLSAASWLALTGYRFVKELASGPATAAYQEREIHLENALAAAGGFGWFAGLLLLGIAALRAQSLPRSLRILPLAVAMLLPTTLIFSALLLPPANSGPDLGTNLLLTFVSILPFLGSALLGWTLLTSRRGAEAQ